MASKGEACLAGSSSILAGAARNVSAFAAAQSFAAISHCLPVLHRTSGSETRINVMWILRNYFLSSASRLEQELVSGCSHALSVCPSVKSNMSMKMSMDHWWNDTDGGEPKYWGKKSVPVPLCPSQIPHGLTRFYPVRGWRLTTWAMARPPLKIRINLSYI
jgi:hypothetical protein